MSTEFWYLVAGGIGFYTILFLADRIWGRRLLNKDFNEREKVLAASIMKSEQAYVRMEETIAVLNRQLGDKDDQLLTMRQSSEARDETIQELKDRIRELEWEVADLERRLREKNVIDKPQTEDVPPTPLLVAIGSDAALKLDLASLRAVRTDTGMNFQRIQDATLEKIKVHLDRARINARPIDKVHLAVHSGPQGIVLSGGTVNSVRFSEILDGVRVLLIAGCESDQVADYLGVVPYVVSITEKVSHTDASLFCRAFWEEIGRGQQPTEALRAALKRAPSGMSEYVDFHW